MFTPVALPSVQQRHNPGSKLMLVDWQAAFARVRSALMRRGRSSHDAEDLVQEAWLRMAAYQVASPVAQPEAFLMRTALNLSIDAYRMQLAHGEEVDVEDVVLIDTKPGIDAALLSKERVARLGVCLERLTQTTREIFLAHRVDGMSYVDIARARGISTKAVEQRVSKAVLLVTCWMDGW